MRKHFALCNGRYMFGHALLRNERTRHSVFRPTISTSASQVTGWGLTETGGYAGVLSEAVLPVVQNEKCQKAYETAGVPLTVSEAMFCAGHANGTSDACSGDSGGPMVFVDDTATTERRWILEGVVSWGSPTGCAVANQYGGFTRVHSFLGWIRQFV